MPPASKRPRTAEEGDGSTPLERKWAAQFKALSPKRQVGVLQRRKEFGHSGLLLDADAPPKQAVASFATQLSAWCPEATSVSVARGGSGGVALGLADTFDIVHAFEADPDKSEYLKHNVELTEKDWVLVHGPATDEEGDYLFALEEIESDVLLVNLLCADGDNGRPSVTERHEAGNEFCEAVEMLIQAIFGKVQMVVALLPGDFDVAKLHKVVSEIPRATKSTAMVPARHENLLLQPIKLGAWGAHLESHQLLQPPASSPRAQKAQRRQKTAAASAGVGPRPLARFRAFESWVKRCFVSHAAAGARKPGSTPPDLVWLDMACGRGADIETIVESGASHLVLADADEDMLTRAVSRFNKKKLYETTALDAVLGDLGAARLHERVKCAYDVVTCFRGLQCGFSDEGAARTWLKNAGGALRHGGIFVGIIPDANVIVKRLQAAVRRLHATILSVIPWRTRGSLHKACVALEASKYDLSVGLMSGCLLVCVQVAAPKPDGAADLLTIENPSYSIDLSETAGDSDGGSSFGHRYRFWLGGAAAKTAGDPGDDEYLVHLPTLLSMAKDEGLELMTFTGLHSFFSDCTYSIEQVSLCGHSSCSHPAKGHIRRSRYQRQRPIGLQWYAYRRGCTASKPADEAVAVRHRLLHRDALPQSAATRVTSHAAWHWTGWI